jgi:hypothetical protein
VTLRVAASSDPRALALRDHLLPLVRAGGAIQDLDAKDGSLRLFVLTRRPWKFTHWTPFNAVAPTEAASPAYRHALERQHTRPDLPYGLEISFGGKTQLALLWADDGAYEIVRFIRGAWEDAAMALQPQAEPDAVEQD